MIVQTWAGEVMSQKRNLKQRENQKTKRNQIRFNEMIIKKKDLANVDTNNVC
jgi:hypothetical protein